jgi:hypothetical protein
MDPEQVDVFVDTASEENSRTRATDLLNPVIGA